MFIESDCTRENYYSSSRGCLKLFRLIILNGNRYVYIINSHGN